MMPHRPEVFVSATTADLGSCRNAIKDALLTLGCVPVEQTTFPPDGATVRVMLRRRIAECQAVVHVAGEAYGAEPHERPATEARRSYTQLEYDLAVELRRPLFVFLCTEGFDYDPHSLEGPALRDLQQFHRQRLRSGDHMRESVSSRAMLMSRVLALQTRVEALARELGRAQRLLRAALAVGLLVVGLIGGGYVWLRERADRSDSRIDAVQADLARQRSLVRDVVRAYSSGDAALVPGRETDEVRLGRAISEAAHANGLSADEVRAAILLFVAAIRSDPAASALDLALAAFAERRFESAAGLAARAADAAFARRQAAERVAARIAVDLAAARGQERDARETEGRAWLAARKGREASRAFGQALSLISREEAPELWAWYQSLRGSAERVAAGSSSGPDVAARLGFALAAYDAALAVFTPSSWRAHWRTATMGRANVLGDLADTRTGPERIRLLGDAERELRSTLLVVARAEDPVGWAFVMLGLAALLSDQADAAQGMQRRGILAEALATVQVVQEALPREADPGGWADAEAAGALLIAKQAADEAEDERYKMLRQASGMQAVVLQVRAQLDDRLGSAMAQLDLAQTELDLAEEDQAEVRTLDAAAAHCRSALESLTRAAHAQDWARAQWKLGDVLAERALRSPRDQRSTALAESIEAHDQALTVLTRQALPLDWALVVSNRAQSLYALAKLQEGEARVALLTASAAACRDALEVLSPADQPDNWAVTQHALAVILLRHADELTPEARREPLQEAVAALRAVQTVRTLKADRDAWRAAQGRLALALDDLAELDEGRVEPALLAVAAYRELLATVNAPQVPEEWATLHGQLAWALERVARASAESERGALLQEAVKVMRASLGTEGADIPDDVREAGERWIAALEEEVQGLPRAVPGR